MTLRARLRVFRRSAVVATIALSLAVVASAGTWRIWQAIDARAVLIAPEPTPVVYDRKGRFLTQIGHRIRDDAGGTRIEYGYWPLRALPERLAMATLALEDRRFGDHPGVDVRAILRAAWRNLAMKRHREGASTIAMQVARMQQPERRGLAAKFNEAATALVIVARYGRDATLLHYLRIAPYGGDGHGAAHAARLYFDRPVEDLSWAQAALLAAIPKSPGRMNIVRAGGLRRAAVRARHAIDRLAAEGALDPTQAAMARHELDAMQPAHIARRPEALHLALRYESLMRDGHLQPPPREDPRIHATIDLDIETMTADLARRYLDAFRPAGARQVAAMVATRDANAVLASVGSADYHDPKAGAYDFTRTPRSPGSTLKPFVYGLALDRGVVDVLDLLDDTPDGAAGVGNFDGQYLGLMTPRQALANSRNVPATNLLRRVGLETGFGFLRDIGLHAIDRPAAEFGVAMAIGALPARLEDLMRAYAAIADDGVMRGLLHARDEKQPPPRRIMTLDTARLLTSFLSDPQARLPSFPRYGPLEYPFPVAVKTGTSQNYRDAWTFAFSEEFIVGVWIGRPDAGAMRGLTGAGSAARLAHALMTRLHDFHPGDIVAGAFPPPAGRIGIEVCRPDAESDCAQTLHEWIKPADVQTTHTATSPRFAPEASSGEGRAMTLTIVSPEHETHIWRNPEQPERLNRLALKLAPDAGDAQIVWIVDGAPFATALASETVFWPMTPGVHRIEARRAFAAIAARPVRVTVE